MPSTSFPDCSSKTSFDLLLGNEEIKNYLNLMVERETFAGSFLFSGQEGVGKSLFALELAKKIFSLNDPSGLQQQKANHGNHPDISVYAPEGKTAMHSIDAIRQLSEEVYMAPYEAEWKVCIIHDADRMLPAGANALLKTFEEPPTHTIMILLTHAPEAILQTILSRCRKLRFQPIASELIERWLVEKQQVIQEKAHMISKICCGSLSQALFLIDEKRSAIREKVLDFLAKGSHPYQQAHAFCAAFSELFDKRKEETRDQLKESLSSSNYKYLSSLQKSALEKENFGSAALNEMHEMDIVFISVLSWYRDLHLLSVQGDGGLLMNIDYRKEMIYLSQKGNIIPLESVEKAIGEARLAVARFIPLSSALETLLLKLGLVD